MADETALDAARTAIGAAPDDLAARLGYYRAFADTELCLLLACEPAGDRIEPRQFSLSDGPVVLVFDSEERLAAFSDQPVPYVALPGRYIAARLAGQGVAIGVNMGDDTAFLMPTEAVSWLAAALHAVPGATSEVAVHWQAPRRQGLSDKLSAVLTGFGDHADRAWLAEATFADTRRSDVLVIEGTRASIRPALAKAAAEGLLFLGALAEGIDVAFLSPDEVAAQGIEGRAEPVTLPKSPVQAVPAPRHPDPPGMDPDRPPLLRRPPAGFNQ